MNEETPPPPSGEVLAEEGRRLARELRELTKKFKDKGICQIVLLGNACACPLCVLDDASLLIDRLVKKID